MTYWVERSPEERALLNPAYCSVLLWKAATGYASVGQGALSYDEAFLVLPLVLPRDTRENLPRSRRTSLAVWLDVNPLTRGTITRRARFLVPFTREALIFGGVYGFLRLDLGKVLVQSNSNRVVKTTLTALSGEVQDCANRAAFVGKWFAETGGPATVLALLGVRP